MTNYFDWLIVDNYQDVLWMCMTIFSKPKITRYYWVCFIFISQHFNRVLILRIIIPVDMSEVATVFV